MPNLSFQPKPVRRQPVLAGPLPQPFTISRRREGSHAVRLVLAGELDLVDRDRLARALEAAQGEATEVVLDLESLTLIDACCLAVVHRAAARARDDQGRLTLLEPRGQVRRILDLTGAPDGAPVLARREAPRAAHAPAATFHDAAPVG